MTEEILTQEGGNNIEERARQRGWAPEDQWRGDPAKWKTAEEFMALADEAMPVLKQNMTRMEKDMAKLRRENEELREGFTELKKYHAGVSQREYDRAYKKIMADMEKAVEEGDTERFKGAKQELESLQDDTKAEIAGKTEPEIKPGDLTQTQKDIIADWEDKHPWYGEDPEMTDYALKVDNMLRGSSKYKGWTQEQCLEEIAKRVQQKFPEHFDNSNPRRQKAGAVEGGEHGMAEGKERGGKKESYQSMPDNARKECDRLTGPAGDGKTGARIPGFTRAEFVADYWSQFK